MLRFLFSPKGRLGRGAFWLFMLAAIALRATIAIILSAQPKGGGAASVLIWLVPGALLCWAFFAVGIKRLHDRGRSYKWIILFFVIAPGLPLLAVALHLPALALTVVVYAAAAVVVWGIVELAFLPGVAGENSHGAAVTAPTSWPVSAALAVTASFLVLAATTRAAPDSAFSRRVQLGAYDVLFALHPTAPVLVARARFEEETGLADRAIADCEAAIRLAPQFASAWFNLARSHAMKGERGQAMTLYGEAIRRNPSFVQAYSNRGWGYVEDGQIESARADFDEALRIDPQFGNALFGRGRALLLLGKSELALADYDAALHLTPDDAELLADRAQAHLLLAHYRRSIADFDRAMRISPPIAQYWMRGLAKFASGDHAGAAADFVVAQRIYPRWPYYGLWLYLALSPGSTARDALAKAAENFDRSRWPWALVASYLGETTADAARAAAVSENERCDVELYLGGLALAEGNAAARQRLASVPTQCSRYAESKVLLDGMPPAR